MSSLLKVHCQGRIQHVGTILRVNLHTIFAIERKFLGLTKKVLMLAIQLKLVTKIELQVWDYIIDDESDLHYYECVPFSLFLEPIAPCLRKNPHHVTITYDTYFQPPEEEEKSGYLSGFTSAIITTLIPTQILSHRLHLPQPLQSLMTWRYVRIGSKSWE